MTLQNSRRSFLAGMGVVAAGAAASSLPLFAFDGKAPAIRFGYASITWGKQDRQAIDDISALGYPGIQMRANAVTDFQPAELRDLLQQHKLTLVALSSGEISLDPARRDETLATHTANANFVRKAQPTPTPALAGRSPVSMPPSLG